MHRTTDIETHIEQLILSATEVKKDLPPRTAFRCSSLPYCGIRSLLQLDKDQDNYSKHHYTKIGTVVHENLQTYITNSRLSKKIWAVWKCRACNTETGPTFKIDKCPKCGNTYLDYEEVTVKYRGLTGHVDLITCIGENSAGDPLFVVSDFKTTSLGRSRQFYNWRNHYPSSPMYMVQLSTYAVVLRIQYKIKVVGINLIFVDRDRPIASGKDFHQHPIVWTRDKHFATKEALDSACDHYDIYTELTEALDTSDGYSKQATRLLKELVKYRPGVDETTYQDWCKKKFYKGDCELKPYCLAASSTVYTEILRRIEQEG